MPPRPFVLAAALPDTGPAPDPDRLRDAARTAESWGLDLVTVEPGAADPLLVAARLAAQTSRIGIVPVVSSTSTEPFHVSTALATIDVVARGRAGWVLRTEDPAAVDGLVTWDVPSDAAGDAAEHLEAVRALWDSWEEGAVIRDAATDRFLDASKVHHVDVTGEHLSVRGPSITPRPPQGHPVVLVRPTDAATLALGELAADVLLLDEAHAPGGAATDDVAAGGPGEADGPLRVVELRVAAGERDDLAARVAALHAAGADGVLLHADDLAGTLQTLVPALESAGLRPAAARADGAADAPPAWSVPDPPVSLRERLGLAPVVNRFEVPA
jgi:alkanesulfonate monooxygenase SsuD/methylene tetrahydromethanopterin reductase-like flavin-dependent oxidoreductase (luciferase family)